MRTPAVLLVAASLALTACSGDAAEPVAAASSPSRSPAATPSPSPSATPPAAVQTSAVAVYYVHDTTTGPRLYREFAARPVADDPVRDAVEAMLTEPPRDPDYASLWPDGTRVLDVTTDGTTVVVDLSQEARDGQAGAAFEEASVQQLVHTVTAAAPDTQAVRVLVEGAAVDTLWGHADLSQPLRRAPAAEVLGPVWVLEPVEGGTVPSSGTVGGTASVFEATVSWEWLRDGEVAASGFVTATEGAPARGEWAAAVDVPPGDYVFRAFEESAEDGSRTFVDDKRVTVTG